jgi:hypothetical protein
VGVEGAVGQPRNLPWIRRRVEPATCYFCGNNTAIRPFTDMPADRGRVELYCDSSDCTPARLKSSLLTTMPTHSRHGRSSPPVARSLDVLGDKWTLLMIHESLCEIICFIDCWRHIPGPTKTTLSAHLQRLVAPGVVETIPTSETTCATHTS